LYRPFEYSLVLGVAPLLALNFLILGVIKYERVV
jgi:hypothetical protein